MQSLVMEGGEGLVLRLVMIPLIVQMVGAVVNNPPPAMYVFGDSTLDVGNNNYLPGAGVARANHPYYGIDYPFQIPTGRFSNGYNTADYAAKSMGFPAGSPPAYLSLLLGPRRHQARLLLAVTALSKGVSYASGDAGILESTNAGYTIPFSEQVRYFKSTKAQMVAGNGSGAVNSLLARSVFLIGIGSNDIFSALSRRNIRSGSAAADQLYSSLVSNYSAAITELYRTGARNFAIINVGLVGCVPAVRLLGPTGACSDDLNQLAAGFNDPLESMLAGLAAKLPGLRYSLADMYGLTTDTFANPQASGGYTDITDACCGSGRLNAETECTPKSRLCTNRDQFVFFDRFHPSQRAALLSVRAFYDGPAEYTTPINFRQLAQTSS